jgi:hypothetical protein
MPQTRTCSCGSREVGNWKNRRFSSRGWNGSLQFAAKKAGIIGKRVHSYLLQHGSATDVAKYLSRFPSLIDM